MELRHLRYFVAVAEEEHFGHAAARLHVSPPPLSRQIQQLEDEVGTALFQRVGRGVRLTDAGRAYLDRAREILADVDGATQAALAAARGEEGHLRIGFAETLPLLERVPRMVRRFRARHPRVTVDLLPLTVGEQTEALRARRIDAGFRYYRPTEAGIGADLIMRDPVVLALPRGHALAKRRTVRVAALRDESFVWSPSPNYYDEVRAALLAHGVTRRVTEVASPVTRLSLVAAGAHLSCIAASAPRLFPDQIVTRPFADLRVDLEAYLAYREEDATSPLVRGLRTLVGPALAPTRA